MDHEHLHAVGAVGGVDAERLPDLQGRRGPLLGLGEIAAAERPALRDAPGEVGVPRLPDALGRPVEVGRGLGEVVGSSREVADDRPVEGGDAARLAVARLGAQPGQLDGPGELDGGQARGQPVPQAGLEHVHQRRPVAAAPRGLDPRAAHRTALVDPSGERQGPPQAAPGTQVARVVRSEGGAGESGAEQVGRATVGEPGPRDGLFQAHRRLQSHQRVGRRRQSLVDAPGSGEVARTDVVRRGLEPQLRADVLRRLRQGCRAIEPQRRLLERQAVYGLPRGRRRVPQRLLMEAEHVGSEVVVGDTWRQRGVAARLKHLRHPGVQRRAAGVRQPVQHRLPRQRVHEPVAVGGTGHRFDEAHRDRGVDRVHARAAVGRAGPDQRRQVEPVADHRGQLDGLPQVRPEAGQPGRDGVAERGGHPLRAAQSRHTPVPFQVEPGLPQEEGVAAGPVAQDRRGGPRGGGRHARVVAHELGDGLGVEPGEVEAAHAVEPVPVGQTGAELVRPVRRGGPEGGHHQRRGVQAGVDHVLEQRDGRQLRPVQVVEDDHQRLVAGDRPEQLGDGLEQAAAAVADRLGRRREVACGVPGQQAEFPGGVQRAGLARQEQVVQHLGERLVGHPGVLRGRAHQHGGALLVQHAGGLGGQAGLARTGLAADQQDLAGSLCDALPDGLQDPELVVAAHEPGPARGDEPGRQGDRAPGRHTRHGTALHPLRSIVRSDPPPARGRGSVPVMTAGALAAHRLRQPRVKEP